MQFICYDKCGTCRKAKKWLDEHGLAYDIRAIKEAPPTEAELREWHRKSGLPLKKFFNTSGQSYRTLKLGEKLKDMSEDEQYRLLASDPMLVKRPVCITDDGNVYIGFREEDYRNLTI